MSIIVSRIDPLTRSIDGRTPTSSKHTAIDPRPSADPTDPTKAPHNNTRAPPLPPTTSSKQAQPNQGTTPASPRPIQQSKAKRQANKRAPMKMVFFSCLSAHLSRRCSSASSCSVVALAKLAIALLSPAPAAWFVFLVRWVVLIGRRVIIHSGSGHEEEQQRESAHERAC